MKKILFSFLVLSIVFALGSADAATLDLCEKNITDWQCISNGTNATLEYNEIGQEFEYNLTVSESFEEDYVLIYYSDQPDRFVDWGGAPAYELGILLEGNVSLNGSVDCGSLPFEDDWNNGDYNNSENDSANYTQAPDFYDNANGAKIWLIPVSNYNGTGEVLNAWNPEKYLFETDLITYEFNASDDDNNNQTGNQSDGDPSIFKAFWLRLRGVFGRGISHAPGLQKERPNENFAGGARDVSVPDEDSDDGFAMGRENAPGQQKKVQNSGFARGRDSAPGQQKKN